MLASGALYPNRMIVQSLDSVQFEIKILFTVGADFQAMMVVKG
jgi:hypothetical protein